MRHGHLFRIIGFAVGDTPSLNGEEKKIIERKYRWSSLYEVAGLCRGNFSPFMACEMHVAFVLF